MTQELFRNFACLVALKADSHHLAAAYRVQFGHTDLDPGRIEVVKQDLCDVLGERFQQIKVAATQYCLNAAHDVRVVEGIFDIISLAGEAVGQGNLQIELQGLRHALFPFINADESFYFKFTQKNDVHCCR